MVNCYGRQRFERQPAKPFLPIELTGLIEVPYLGHFAEFDELILRVVHVCCDSPLPILHREKPLPVIVVRLTRPVGVRARPRTA